MPKYTICGIIKSTVALGECEAETPEKAIKKFKNTPRAEWAVNSCQLWPNEIKIEDFDEIQVNLIEEEKETMDFSIVC